MKRRTFLYILLLAMGCITCLSGCDNYPQDDSELLPSMTENFSFRLDKYNVTLKVGETVRINAFYNNVRWSSSNKYVATVDNNGTVTAVGEGSATITAQPTNYANAKATCNVNVDPAPIVPDIPQGNEETRTFTIGGVTFKMVLVEAGTFQMGGTEHSFEIPIHNVTISKDFYMGETEVTQALWKAVTGYSPTTDAAKQWTDEIGRDDDYPAYYISYEDVQSFITKLNSLTGENFRMPTEAEWEYAARGGKKSKGYTYSGSNTIGDVAWYADNSSSKTHAVKTKAANELGIHDMSGNVWEFCSDWFDTYSSSAQTDPTGPTTGTRRVYRGGGWNSAASSCRCANRSRFTPSFRGSTLGVRLAL